MECIGKVSILYVMQRISVCMFIRCNMRSRKYDEDGIDLNRNFPVCFDIDEKGSNSRPCAEDYRVCLVFINES